jgi:hypothetical protein
MNWKDAIHENEPYILVEGPGWGNVEFFGKWLSAAAKADALWNKAIKDRIFKEQVLQLWVLYFPNYGMAAMSFVSMLQESPTAFMVPVNCELFEELYICGSEIANQTVISVGVAFPHCVFKDQPPTGSRAAALTKPAPPAA